MSYRDLVARIFPRRLAVFDSINNSIDFAEDRDGLLGRSPVFPDRQGLHRHVGSMVAGEPITYLEFGVWKGDSFKLWLQLNQHSTSRFVGFDTFTGLPEDWTPSDPKGKFSTGGTAPQISDPRGSFVTGLFQETLYDFLAATPPTHGRFVLHVDCDLYSSTLFVLGALDRFFRPGTIVIFDDFHSLNHEFAAWRDYRRAFSRTWKPLAKTEQCLQAAFAL